MKVVTHPSFYKRNFPDSIDIKESLLGVNAILFLRPGHLKKLVTILI